MWTRIADDGSSSKIKDLKAIYDELYKIEHRLQMAGYTEIGTLLDQAMNALSEEIGTSQQGQY